MMPRMSVWSYLMAQTTDRLCLQPMEILIEFLTFFSGKGTLFRVKAVAIARSLQRNRGVLVPASNA